MTNRIIKVVALSALACTGLSLEVLPSAERGIACLDGLQKSEPLGLSADLFGEIRDEALRKSARDYYLFLSQVEARALGERQAIYAAYGLSSFAPSTYAPVKVSDFFLGQAQMPQLNAFSLAPKAAPSRFANWPLTDFQANGYRFLGQDHIQAMSDAAWNPPVRYSAKPVAGAPLTGLNSPAGPKAIGF